MSTNHSDVIGHVSAAPNPDKMPSMQNQPSLSNVAPGKMKHVRQLGNSVHVAAGRAVMGGHERAYAGGALGLQNKQPFQGGDLNVESHGKIDATKSYRGLSESRFDIKSLN